MASDPNLSQDIVDEVNRQHAARQAALVTPDVVAEIDRQERLRNGDYGDASAVSAAKAVYGVTENVGSMIVNFAAAAPGAVWGTAKAIQSVLPPTIYGGQPEGKPGERYLEGFKSVTEPVSDYTRPTSEMGKKYEDAIADTYNEYINVKWGGYVEGLLDEGRISPEEATYYKTSADALVLGLFMKAGQYARAAGAKVADIKASRPGGREWVDLDAKPLTGEYMPGESSGGLPATRGQTIDGLPEFNVEVAPKAIGQTRRITGPKGELTEDVIPIAVAVRGALDKGVPRNLIEKAVNEAKTPEGVIESVGALAKEGRGPVTGAEGRLLAPASLTNEMYLDNPALGEFDPKTNQISLNRDEWKKLSSDEKLRLLRHEEGHAVEEMLTKPQRKQFIEIAAKHKDAIAKWAKDYAALMRPEDSRYAYEAQLGEMFADYWRDRRNGADLDQWRNLGIEEDFAKLVDDIEIIQDSSDPRTIFKNRQAGAVDPEVLAEFARIVARPGVATAKQVADLSHALARQVAFKHVTDIRKINSPTAKMLADRIMPLETSTIELGGGFHELISLKEGEYQSRMEILLEPLRRQVINRNAIRTLRLIALPKRVNADIFTALRIGKSPEYLVPTVRAIRGILNDILNYQNEAGAQVAKRDNYLPQMWDIRKISRAEFGRKNGGKYTQYLMEKEGLTFDAAQEVIANLTHDEGFMDFVEDAGGRLGPKEDYNTWAGRTRGIQGGATKPGHTKQRVLKGDPEWLINDVETILTSYINRAVRHAEYTRLAGKNETTLNQTVRQIIEEQAVGGHEGGKLRTNSPHTTAQEIYDMFDALQGRYNQIKNPAVRRASKAVAGYQVIQKLGLVTLAQFPESMMPIARYRMATSFESLPAIPIPLKSYGVGMVDAAANAMSAASKIITGRRLIPKTVMRQHLERIGVIASSSLTSSASRMAGPVGTITSRVIRMFGIETITNFQRTVALDTINSMIRQNARYLAKGKNDKKARMYRQELTELGLKPEAVVEWYEAGMPEDSPISRRFDIAHVRGIDTNIIMPKAANAPRLYNDPRWQLVLEFTRFFTVFGNTVLKNVGKKLASGDVTNTRKLASVSALLTAVGIAYYTQFLREDISGYKFRDDDDPLRIVDAVDRAGLTAMFTRLYPLFSAYRYGQGHKYIAGLLGPAASDVAGFIEAAGDKKRMARWMAKMTPIMTVTPESEDLMYDFYLEMIEAAEDVID